ncbi:hypothetical protein IR152_17915 [Clostridioides sp. ES-S-0108-01]|uniref:hypothetical protein n=1 Tax=Clostridioides sp. ES-S-0108-01 TaxID=2770773 RepID=UPI001D0C5FD7|nr:hypothetical protein [Clostridioides sp. ES-S-0108-01]UDN49701.1 hypothetical protein JJC16_09905 [Clostridioides sp. ES-S-0107-01]
MKEKKKMIGVVISFLLIISIINPLQAEAEVITDSSVYISSTQENYISNNTRFKTIKSKTRHKRSKSSKSRVKLKKRTIRTKTYGHGILNKHKRQGIRRYNILSKLVLSIIVMFIVIVLVILILVKRKKKKFY